MDTPRTGSKIRNSVVAADVRRLKSLGSCPPLRPRGSASFTSAATFQTGSKAVFSPLRSSGRPPPPHPRLPLWTVLGRSSGVGPPGPGCTPSGVPVPAERGPRATAAGILNGLVLRCFQWNRAGSFRLSKALGERLPYQRERAGCPPSVGWHQPATAFKAGQMGGLRSAEGSPRTRSSTVGGAYS